MQKVIKSEKKTHVSPVWFMNQARRVEHERDTQWDLAHLYLPYFASCHFWFFFFVLLQFN